MDVKKSIQRKLVTARKSMGYDLNRVQSVTGISRVVLEGFEHGDFDIIEPVFTRLALETYADFLGLNVEILSSDLNSILGEKASHNNVGVSKREKHLNSLYRSIFFRIVFVFFVLIATFLFVIAFLDTEDHGAPSVRISKEKVGDVADSTGLAGSFLRAEIIEEGKISSIKETVSNIGKEQFISSLVIEMTEHESSKNVASPAVDSIDRVLSEGGSAIPLVPGNKDNSSQINNGTEFYKSQNIENQESTIDIISNSTQTLIKEKYQRDSLSLSMRTVDTTWVRVKMDNSSFFESLMLPGQRKRLTAMDSFFVHSGKPHGVIFYLNGKLLTKDEIGESNRVLRFSVAKDSVTILDYKFNPIRNVVLP